MQQKVFGLTVEIDYIRKMYLQLKSKGINPRKTEILDCFDEEEIEYIIWVKDILELVDDPSATNIGNKGFGSTGG